MLFKYLPKEFDTNRCEYQVSRCGKVRSVSKKTKKTKLSTQHKTEGYLRVNIGRKTYGVHILVAIAFIPKPENYDSTFTVHHIDNDKLNNHVTNLCWASRPRQSKERRENCRTLIHSMPVIATKISGGSVLTFDSINATKEIGADPRTVSKCINKKRKYHFGYTWSPPPSDKPLPEEKFKGEFKSKTYTVSVSNFGRIKYEFECKYVKIVSSFDKITERSVEECDSYPKITIDDEDHQLHNIVWKLHVGDIPPGMIVNHKDHDKRNAALSNLELITKSKNTFEAHNAGRFDNTKSARVAVEIDDVTYVSMHEAARQLGFSIGMIHKRLKSPNFPTYKRV